MKFGKTLNHEVHKEHKEKNNIFLCEIFVFLGVLCG